MNYVPPLNRKKVNICCLAKMAILYRTKPYHYILVWFLKSLLSIFFSQ